MLTFYELWCKVRGKCLECHGTRDKRGYVLKPTPDGKTDSFPCQDSFHGARNYQPGQQCQNHQGKTVIMPDVPWT